MATNIHVLANRIVALETAAVLGDLTHEQQQCLIAMAHELRIQYARHCDKLAPAKNLTPREIENEVVWSRKQNVRGGIVEGRVVRVHAGRYCWQVTVHYPGDDQAVQHGNSDMRTAGGAKSAAHRCLNAQILKLAAR